MLTDKQEERLERSSRIGKTVWHKKKGGGAYQAMGIVVDEVYVIVGEYKHLIQRIEFADGAAWGGNKYAYRTGYYTYDANKRHVKWGQYTQFLTESEYRELLLKARQRGWDVFSADDRGAGTA